MSQVTRCDECGDVLQDADDIDMDSIEWVHVEWGVGRERHKTGDYCTAACAQEAIGKQLEVAVEQAMTDDAAQDGGEDVT